MDLNLIMLRGNEASATWTYKLEQKANIHLFVLLVAEAAWFTVKE